MDNIIKEPVEKLDGIKKECYDYFNNLIFSKTKNINCFIAGGCLRKFFNKDLEEKDIASDIDIYFHNEKELNRIFAPKIFYSLFNAQKENEIKLLYSSSNAYCYKKDDLTLDIIRRGFNKPEATISKFDFTICCAALDNTNFYYHKDYFEHLKDKKIVINIRDSIVDIGRVEKYMSKGYVLQDDQKELLAKLNSENKVVKSKDFSSEKKYIVTTVDFSEKKSSFSNDYKVWTSPVKDYQISISKLYNEVMSSTF